MDMLSKYQERFNTIQALRGIAAFAVVLCHIYFNTNSVGAFGVDIFFCISGFIMMHVTENGTKHFLQKRMLRILPLYWGLTLISFSAILMFPKLINLNESTLETLLKSFFFIPYKRNGLVEPILQVGWTLNLEMCFYVLFFLSAKIKRDVRHFICSGMLIFLVLSGIFIKTDNLIFNFFTKPIMLEFVLGMFTFVIFKKMRYNNRFANHIALKIIPFVLILYMILMQHYELAHYDRFFLYGIPAMFLLLCFIMGFKDYELPKPMIILGNISFSLYLIHYPTLVVFNKLVYPLDKINIFSLSTSLGYIACSITCAYISWYLIENKFTKHLSNIILSR